MITCSLFLFFHAADVSQDGGNAGGKCYMRRILEGETLLRFRSPFLYSVLNIVVLQVVLVQSRAFGCSIIPCLRAYVHLRWAKLYDVRSTTLELDSIRVSFCLRFGSVYALVPKSQVEEGRTICRADDWTFPRFGECRKTSFERKLFVFKNQNKSLNKQRLKRRVTTSSIFLSDGWIYLNWEAVTDWGQGQEEWDGGGAQLQRLPGHSHHCHQSKNIFTFY